MLCLLCRCSSVVEHVIGNDGVESPILFSGTNTKTDKSCKIKDLSVFYTLKTHIFKTCQNTILGRIKDKLSKIFNMLICNYVKIKI